MLKWSIQCTILYIPIMNYLTVWSTDQYFVKPEHNPLSASLGLVPFLLFPVQKISIKFKIYKYADTNVLHGITKN